uniref:Amine oxidase n=1 Tax=Fagus sylvatica TaxID=28930 RepID=A0A2N9EH32_FAGSY
MATTMKLILFLLLSFYIFSLVVSSHQHHPLDPLTPSEFTLVRTIVNKSHPSTKHNITFQYIGLDEPDKPVLLSWLSNPKSKPPPRRAFVITRLDKQSHEIIVDLSTRSIVSDKIYHGHGYPLLTFDEQIVASELPQTYQPFLESIKKRGLNLSDVVCSDYSVGWFGEVESKRVLKLLCFYIDGSVNLYVRPLEGITLVVDLDEMKIVEYYDRFIVPVPKAEGTDYRASKQKPPFGPRLNGAVLVQPDGPGFKIDGHTVSWANWVFHLGFDVRADPTEEWYYKTFFDSGEFGFGQFAVSLKPLVDCPANAVFLDSYYAAEDGTPVKISNTFCIFENHAGHIMWRHTELGIPGEVIREVRPEVSLVVRMVSTVGNYDYIIDWEFKPSGSIKLGIGLIGVLEVKGVTYTHIDQIKEDVHGTLLADNTIGVYHDHFLTYYLDLDVDGEANSFVKNNLETIRVKDHNSPRKSYWTVKTKVGNNVGYRLIPGSVSEKWAGGVYVDQSRGDDTLAIWSLRNRQIENKDIVLWYTIGFHNVPCQEDFPLMPTLSGGFELRPTNFFDSNPVLKTRPPNHVHWPNCTTQR